MGGGSQENARLHLRPQPPGTTTATGMRDAINARRKFGVRGAPLALKEGSWSQSGLGCAGKAVGSCGCCLDQLIPARWETRWMP